ncbi:MAG: hypothetical protein K6B13_02135 [Prevotella sp.]|nr:hypothetical protein [Prevotella sp.]
MVDVKELRVQFFLLVGNFMHHTTQFFGIHRHVFVRYPHRASRFLSEKLLCLPFFYYFCTEIENTIANETEIIHQPCVWDIAYWLHRGDDLHVQDQQSSLRPVLFVCMGVWHCFLFVFLQDELWWQPL